MDFTPIGRWVFVAGVEYRDALWCAMLVEGWGVTDPVCRTPVACMLAWSLVVAWDSRSGSRELGDGGRSSRLNGGHHPHGPSTYIRMQYPFPLSPPSLPSFGSESWVVVRRPTSDRGEAKERI